MRITRILHLRDCGIFRDFSCPAELPDFGRYNLVYGWNGTGKTTLSRILRCLEKRMAPAGKVKVKLDGRDVQGNNFPSVELPIRVFNRDFIAENVFRVDGRELQPIFVLGAESIEKQKEIERLKSGRATALSNRESAESAQMKVEKEFDQFCIDRARLIKETLRSEGKNPYNNYDKSNFRADAEKMAKDGDGSADRLSEEDREKLRAQQRAIQKLKVQEVRYALPDFSEILKKISELLKTSFVSAAIEALKRDPTLAEWTRQGLRLHRDRNAERCLFCEQALPKERLAALEAHFSAQYEHFIEGLDQEIAQLQQLSKAATELQLPNKAELYDDLGQEFEAAVTELKEAVNAAQRFLNAVVQALTDKKRRLFECVQLELKAPMVDAEVVERLNAVIRKHNQACDEFEQRVKTARKQLADAMIAEVLDEFKKHREGIQQAEDDAEKARQEVQLLVNEITRLERDIVEHRRPAEELNIDLRTYLGHNELRFEIRTTGYAITRGGVPALALSEGEMTAIALLYFLKTLRDSSFDLPNGAVVIDDPVSSLDANALYLAFGLIRERTKDAGQLFILTHNFSFFRQVRNWFHHLKGQNKRDLSQQPARFYMLDCVHDSNGRCATIRHLDPLLEKYDSEYHYLFARVYRASNETGPKGLEENYVLPNMARRLLEAFLAFRQPQASGELWQKVQAVPFDEAKKMRILRFLHTCSHSSAIGEPEHDPSILAEGIAVLKDLLEMIRSQDEAHFSALVQLMASPQDAAEHREQDPGT